MDSVSRLREQLQRVDQLPVREDLVVHVRAGGAAGRADEADDVAALELGSRLDVVPAQMAVPRHEAEHMFDDDQVVVVAFVRTSLDCPVGGRVYRLAFFGGYVEPLVKRRLA